MNHQVSQTNFRWLPVLVLLSLVVMGANHCDTEKRPSQLDIIQQQVGNLHSEVRQQIGQLHSEVRQQIGGLESDVRQLRSDVKDQAETRAEIRELRSIISNISFASVENLRNTFLILIGVAVSIVTIIIVAVLMHLNKLTKMNYELHRMRMQMDDRNRQIIHAIYSVDDNRQSPRQPLRPMPPALPLPPERKVLKP